MKKKIVTIPAWEIKAEFEGKHPSRVSFFGAMPQPKEAYNLIEKKALEVTSNGRVTYHNIPK